MKIVCFSINPLFPDRITGGASKHFVNLCLHLGTLGHKVLVLCAEAAPGQQSFMMAENVEVKPVLPFHQPFPQPYMVSPNALAQICEIISAELAKADRFYVHDGELLLPFLYKDIPTIVGFRDNIYPESVLGSFIQKADAILSVSHFSAAVIKATAGRLFPGLSARVHTVLNGIDPQLFHPSDPTPIIAKLDLREEDWPVIIHPHRPEEGKGLLETIKLADVLVHQYGFTQLKVLVPQWLGEMEGEVEDAFHRRVLAELAQRGLEDHFIFHPWLSQAEMPAYFSAGSLTVSLGFFVEAFGNVAYESLVCGTPSMVARVGVHRTQLPDDLIIKIDYGDIAAAAALAADVFQSRRRVEGEELAQILAYFSIGKQMEAYTSLILGAEKLPEMEYQPKFISVESSFRLAPWAYCSDTGIFHDYKAAWISDALLCELLAGGESEITLQRVEQAGGTREMLFDWYHQGILIPD